MSQAGHPHQITIEPYPKRVKASFRGIEIADSSQALLLREGPLPPAIYFPREDVQMNQLQQTTHGSHCPFKGDANYFSVNSGATVVENAVWTYESPIPAVEIIQGYLSFDREKGAEFEEVS